MSSKRLWATTVTILAGLSVLDPRSSRVWAQSGQAVCPAGWEWNENSLGQDPCQIVSLLEASCRGAGTFTIPPLNSAGNYAPPQQNKPLDLKCDCNSVMYSLYMACTACQGARVYSWTGWDAQCQNVYVTQYPDGIPKGTAIPFWAFFNVVNLPGQTFDPSKAKSIGRNPEATPAGGGNGADKSGSKSSSGIIIGGVVGGVVLIILLVVAALLCLKRRRQRRETQPSPPPPDIKEAPEVPEVPDNPEDQPASPVFSTASTTLPGSPYYNTGDPLAYPNPSKYGTPPSYSPGQYRGFAEVQNVRMTEPVRRSSLEFVGPESSMHPQY